MSRAIQTSLDVHPVDGKGPNVRARAWQLDGTSGLTVDVGEVGDALRLCFYDGARGDEDSGAIGMAWAIIRATHNTCCDCGELFVDLTDDHDRCERCGREEFPDGYDVAEGADYLDRVEQLLIEAGYAGDHKTVEDCKAVLEGDVSAAWWRVNAILQEVENR
jgi:hypothetical protein